jgi:two-component system, OmpR family, sensor histidine kinase CpxA
MSGAGRATNKEARRAGQRVRGSSPLSTLFLKMFVGFLLVTTTAFVISHYGWRREDFSIGAARWEKILTDVLETRGARAVELYEHQNYTQLHDYLLRENRRTELAATLLDQNGNVLEGRPLPPFAAEALAEATHERRMAFSRAPDQLAGAEPVTAGDGRQFFFVLVVERLHPPLPPGALFHLGAFVFITALLCYVLALYLAAPVTQVRAAIGRLAQGDLSTRVAGLVGHRRDELADLACDFDLMAERIEMLVTSQRRLLSDISHELRSPLARSRVALELARQRSGAEAQSALDRIETESERMNTMIGQLLTLTSEEAGLAAQPASVFGLRALLQGIATDAMFEVSNSQRTVCLSAPEDCAVRGHREVLRSAVENVVRNALRYTPDGTAVDINLRCEKVRDASEGVIEIRDRGDGVPGAELERIFDVFYRVAADRDRQTGGTGLGLAITKRAVLLHGGTVTARNAESGGLLMEIRLPVA